MLRGFVKLTWLEIKIFVREPLGVVGTLIVPVAVFLLFGRSMRSSAAHSGQIAQLLGEGIPILITLLIVFNAVISLVTVISIYREGGILKRLRATPLRPTTILGAHVTVKLLFTAASLALLMLAGRRLYPVALNVHVISFALALLFSTLSILTIGFVIASLVPTARFAQPITGAILYPTLALCGLLVPVKSLPIAWATLGSVLPVTHAVSLMRGAWAGESWLSHLPDVGVLSLTMVVCLALSARIFRWK
jgi:ABC-2 type transport system permease protein